MDVRRQATQGEVAEEGGSPTTPCWRDAAQGGSPPAGRSVARRPRRPVLRSLFGEHATDIKTWVLIPLGGASPFGALRLGSRDPYRFHAGMGTVYLTRLGELLTHGLARHRHG